MAPVGAAVRSEVHPGHRRLDVMLFDRPKFWDFFSKELHTEGAQLGWVEGSNLTVEWRLAEGNAARLPATSCPSCCGPFAFGPSD